MAFVHLKFDHFILGFEQWRWEKWNNVEDVFCVHNPYFLMLGHIYGKMSSTGIRVVVIFLTLLIITNSLIYSSQNGYVSDKI